MNTDSGNAFTFACPKCNGESEMDFSLIEKNFRVACGKCSAIFLTNAEVVSEMIALVGILEKPSSPEDREGMISATSRFVASLQQELRGQVAAGNAII